MDDAGGAYGLGSPFEGGTNDGATGATKVGALAACGAGTGKGGFGAIDTYLQGSIMSLVLDSGAVVGCRFGVRVSSGTRARSVSRFPPQQQECVLHPGNVPTRSPSKNLAESEGGRRIGHAS